MWKTSEPSDSTSVPRSRWKVRNAKDPGIATANSPATTSTVRAAEAHTPRLRMPTRISAGHTFSSAPKPTSAPATRGCRAAARTAATATAVTITS
ncbi:hypothetical protein RKD19_005982 [Streptomyces canus]